MGFRADTPEEERSCTFCEKVVSAADGYIWEDWTDQVICLECCRELGAALARLRVMKDRCKHGVSNFAHCQQCVPVGLGIYSRTRHP